VRCVSLLGHDLNEQDKPFVALSYCDSSNLPLKKTQLRMQAKSAIATGDKFNNSSQSLWPVSAQTARNGVINAKLPVLRVATRRRLATQSIRTL